MVVITHSLTLTHHHLNINHALTISLQHHHFNINHALTTSIIHPSSSHMHLHSLITSTSITHLSNNSNVTY